MALPRGYVTLLAAEANVVATRRLWPRSLAIVEGRDGAGDGAAGTSACGLAAAAADAFSPTWGG